MTGYETLGVVAAGVTAGAAAWTTWLSPWAKKRRLAVHQQLEFHRDWNGLPGRPGVERQPGVMERLAAVEAALKAPILNGRGERLLDTVDRLDTRTERLDGRTARFGRRIAALERRHDSLEQWLEARFAEQITVIGEAVGPVD